MILDPQSIRRQFPSLHQEVDGRPAVFLDGPGGTQTPLQVIEAIAAYLGTDNANEGGAFRTSRNTEETVERTREALVDLLRAPSPREVVIGANMTTLTLSISRSLARTWQQGDEIVVTRIDHDANVSPWLLAAADRGVEVRWLDFRTEDCTLELDTLEELLGPRTRLLAINYASNAVGTINDVAHAARVAREAGVLTYVDAVHYAPHGPIDVQALGCDFLVSSPYKYFGPHSGVLWGRLEQLERLEAYKVRPAPAESPGKWETGTPAFEAIAGIGAAVDYLAALGGEEGSRRQRLERAMDAIVDYERELAVRFLDGVATIPGLRIHGITDRSRLDQRTPTFGLALEGWSPAQLSQRLGEQGFFTWAGHYYAVEVMRRLGVLDSGGLLRVGFVHYNTIDEVDRLLEALDRLARSTA